jgi:hypothetical protein
MRYFACTAASIVLLAFVVPHEASAWGKVGHATVADIAEAHLTPTALAEVKKLLAVEGDKHMSDISSWADEAKAEGLEGSPSHTIRLPMDNSPASAHPCPGGFCAGDAIERYGAVLSDPTKSDAEREIALKYIVHLVGDLHQPLHDVNATGSGIKVKFRNEDKVLHQVWDEGIIDEHGGSAVKLAKELDKTEAGVKTGGTPMDWAIEGRIIAQTKIYNTIPLKPTGVIVLPRSYAKDNWPIVAQRLEQGGLRLAEVLNKLLQ